MAMNDSMNIFIRFELQLTALLEYEGNAEKFANFVMESMLAKVKL